MGKAEAKEDIPIGFAKNMRHIGIVAHDFNRGGDALNLNRIVIIGQRPRGEPVNQQQDHHAQRNEKHRQSDKPAKHQCHRGVLGWRAD